ncbi:LamG domain-containing protein [Piscinibacter sakaiensis]|uniref:LamG domain-containing protein n=1 Tax=Piscinibacter sakaiensis TaxID=1547922 RepID=UPI003AAB6037
MKTSAISQETRTLSAALDGRSGQRRCTSGAIVARFASCAILLSGLASPAFAQTALDFDGSDDHVAVPNHPTLQVSAAWTMAAWIRWTGSGPLQTVLARPRAAGGTGISMNIRPDGSITSGMNDGVGFNGAASAPAATVVPGEWMYATAVYTGSELRIYMNGTLRGTLGPLPGTVVGTSTQPFLVGVEGSASPLIQRQFSGSIDEVSYWSVARTQPQIVDAMNNCLTGAEPGLITYLKFNEGAGSSSALDLSPNGNNGTLVNMDASTDWVSSSFCPSNAAPVCTNATPTTAMLWPPNHHFTPISLNGVSDADGDSVVITIDGIRQDEKVKGPGKKHPDAHGVGTSIAQLRAERDGKGDGRVYHVAFTASDGNGGSCQGTVKVGVPHDQGKNGGPPIDGGPLFDSTLE